ncbi:uncharacterized protein LOC122375237, partial [Amphibalanus amphitrite]|uniref:uncharacterized protein LOC122375237 n=1 Tax=Amphibalanus amphitrite TaxID=1232801 RepID=UPI001C90914F
MSSVARLPLLPSLPLLLLLFLLLTLLPDSVNSSRYAHGTHRSGRHLSGPSPLQEYRVARVLHCVARCSALPDCRALQFNSTSPSANCQLFAERACPLYQLQVDPTTDYYDVYQDVTTEAIGGAWSDQCVQDGLCSPDCGGLPVGEVCSSHAQCQHTDLPDGSYQCLYVEKICAPKDGFWEVRPGFLLPEWMSWSADIYFTTYKKLKPGTLELKMNVTLGKNAQWELRLCEGYHGNAVKFLIRESDKTVEISLPSGEPQHIPNVGFINSVDQIPLKITWNNDTVSFGRTYETPLLSLPFDPSSYTFEYVTVRSSKNVSLMTIHSNVADPWLFEESGITSDPVWELSGPWSPSESSPLVTRWVESPATEIDVTFDCMADA